MFALTDRDFLIGGGLAFVAGFVDAAAFIALTGLFTAHVTGNFVLIGAELASSSSGVVAKLLALPVFILAVALTRLIALALDRHGWEPLQPLLAFEAAILIAFALTGAVLSPLGGDQRYFVGPELPGHRLFNLAIASRQTVISGTKYRRSSVKRTATRTAPVPAAVAVSWSSPPANPRLPSSFCDRAARYVPPAGRAACDPPSRAASSARSHQGSLPETEAGPSHLSAGANLSLTILDPMTGKLVAILKPKPSRL